MGVVRSKLAVPQWNDNVTSCCNRHLSTVRVHHPAGPGPPHLSRSQILMLLWVAAHSQ